MEFREDISILKRVQFILDRTEMPHIKKTGIFCARSYGSRGHAIARIYSFPKVWQLALKMEPKYVIEVISEKFDKLSDAEKDKILIHELMHIPKTFSGSLVPHNCFGRKLICSRTVEIIYKEFVKNCYEQK